MSPISHHQHREPTHKSGAHLGKRQLTKQKRMIIQAGLMLKLLLLLVLVLAPAEITDAASTAITQDNTQSPVQAIRFKMPKWVLAGADRLRLVCDYDLSGQTMHAMKLFKDNKEFYRYTPDERKLAFPVPGVNVDVDRSNGRDVWLRRLDRRSGGEYRCEVSVEETFRSMSMARNLEVRSSPPAPSTQPPAASTDSSSASKQSPRQQQQPIGGSWNLLKSPSAKSIPQTAEQQQAASSGAQSDKRPPLKVNPLLWLLAILLPLLQVCL